MTDRIKLLTDAYYANLRKAYLFGFLGSKAGTQEAINAAFKIQNEYANTPEEQQALIAARERVYDEMFP